MGRFVTTSGCIDSYFYCEFPMHLKKIFQQKSVFRLIVFLCTIITVIGLSKEALAVPAKVAAGNNYTVAILEGE